MKNDTTEKFDKSKYPSAKYYEFASDYRSDLDTHDHYITDFDAYEAMLISKTYDAVSKQTKSGITDSDSATMVIERAARVVSQLPDGQVVAAGKKDKGKALYMDILRQKWIYPNANAQRPFLDKIRLWEMYSSVYGLMPMYYDWDVSPSGYVGPNCWLWNPRNFIPQQGRYSIADMDYVHAISYMSHKEVQDLIDEWTEESGWDKDALETLLEVAKNSSKDQDSKRDSYVERGRNDASTRDRVQVVTRYEAGDDGHWITFAPEFASLLLRDIKNPHKSGKIPFVIKPAIPLFDSFYNLSDMARAKPIQFAKDGLTNFYFQGIKMNIYPPTVVNAQGILKHTVSNEPGAIWEEIIPNSARRLETSTAGLATYQNAMGQMSGALQNVFGTTTTQLTNDQANSPQFGKTPDAIKYQTSRESARDNQNRALLQQAIEELIDGMMALIPNMGTEEMMVDLFADDLAAIEQAGFTDVDDIFKKMVKNESGETARLVLDPAKLKGVEYRFNMIADSTVKADKETQRANLKDIMDTLAHSANILQVIQQTTNKVPDYEKLLNQYATLADLPGIDSLFIDAPPQPQDDTHPVIKLMEVLKIDFNALPEDSKQEILQLIGAPSQQMSPAAQEMQLKIAQAHTQAVTAGANAAKTGHDMGMAEMQNDQQQVQPQIDPAMGLNEHDVSTTIQPRAVNGTVYNDPVVAAHAEALHQMMKG